MKKVILKAGILTTLLSFGAFQAVQACGCSDACSKKKTTAKHSAKQAKDLVDTAVSAGSFNTLVAAVKAAGLVETLKGDGPFTVFAPTDEAFAKLPAGTVENLLKPENKDKLAAVLTYHVVAGNVTAEQVVGLDSAKTVSGGKLAIDANDNGVKIGEANVVKTDIKTSNGIIHVIDTVLIPTEG